MKELIMQALDEAYERAKTIAPKTKRVYMQSKSIFDIKPIELLEFMKANNIPSDAVFDGSDNGYDAFDDIVLSWTVERETTPKEIGQYIAKRFPNIALKAINDSLIKNGYRKVKNAGFHKDLYNEYINKELDYFIGCCTAAYTKTI